MDFTYLYKTCYASLEELTSLPEYDYYISAESESDRIKLIAGKIRRKNHVVITPESQKNTKNDSDSLSFIITRSGNFDVMSNIVKSIEVDNKRICIDSTGLLIPDLLSLLRLFNSRGVRELDVLYAEPLKYKDDEDTKFSDCFFEVSQVTGMAGRHTSEMDEDLLILAVGYDHSRIIDVANKKKSARKVLLYGFPSISPGMFQENVVRVHQAEHWLGADCFKDMDMNMYAPAYDPFVTAQVIKDYVRTKEYSNLYLAPLSSKPHALGMALFFLWEKGYEKNISIIYPMCDEVYTDYSEGVGRIWKYNFILPGENHGE